MAKYKFNEVLNDLMNYFVLGDPDYLLQYKIENNLPNDLLTEFTTKESGDKVVEQGAIIPITGIENYPYTVYFTLSGEKPELLKKENQLQHRKDGYCLKVENERIFLYTFPYLKDFTIEKLATLKKLKTATIKIPNGWYSVSILGGLTKQITEIENLNGEIVKVEDFEPTFEFLIEPTEQKPKYTADFSYQFNIKEQA